MVETKKRKRDEQRADEESPTKIAATETDSAYEDLFPYTANSKISIGKGDPQTYPQAQIFQKLQVILHQPRTKRKMLIQPKTTLTQHSQVRPSLKLF